MIVQQKIKQRNKVPRAWFAYATATVLTVILLLLSALGGNAQSDDARTVFKKTCSSCHTLSKQKLIGPGLAGITKKRSQEWLIDWIRDSQKMIAEGDADALAVYKEYQKQVMPSHDMTDEQIIALLEYMENPGPADEAAAAAAAAEAGEGDEPGTTEDGVSTGYRITMWLVILLLAIVLAVAIPTIRTAKKAMKGEYDFEDEQEGLLFQMNLEHTLNRYRKVVALAVIALIFVSLKLGWDELATIGIQQGYQPTQPIAFSHAVHAGQNEISCNYCHSGARSSKTAGIPSANVCMNCHSYVSEGTKTGTSEIAKIYEALDYDPAEQTYGDNPKPIEWVRVHNLPDFAYFNHSQHVTVGQLECQTCHGPIEEMEEVKQHSKLTMEWCINCHQDEEVKFAGNPYYDDLHKALKERYPDEKLTVEKIGGWDCAKCHY